MTPLRSISQIPKLDSEWTKEQFGSTTGTNKITQYKFVIDSEHEAPLSALEDDQMFIETSYNINGSYLSRKVDFGKLLRYITNSLSILDNALVKTYLTQEEAQKTYLPLAGGRLTGPLEIWYDNGGSKPSVDKPALTIKAGTTNANKPVGIRFDNDATISFNNDDYTVIKRSYVKTPSLTCTGNINCNETLTAKTLTGHNLTVDTSFQLPHFKFDNDENRLFADVRFDLTDLHTTNLTVDTTLDLQENLNVLNGTITGKNVTVNDNLTVTGTASVGSLTADAEIRGNNFVATTANDNDKAFKADHGTVIAPKINGTESVFVNETLKMTKTDGLVATTKISQLTAQYACWA